MHTRPHPRRPHPRAVLLLAPLLLATGLLGGCSALGTLAALEQVRLSFDGVSGGRLAGVDLSGARTYSDLARIDLVRIAAAYVEGSLPLAFTAHVGAENPGANAADARLERLGWTLRLNGRDAVSGMVDRPIVLPAGRSVDLPIAVEVDLLELNGESREELVDLALRLLGRGGDPVDLELAVRPTVSTPLGPIAYPGEIVLERKGF